MNLGNCDIHGKFHTEQVKQYIGPSLLTRLAVVS